MAAATQKDAIAMLETTLTCSPGPTIPNQDARWPAPSIHVAYLGPDDIGALRVRDSLDILVPTVQARLFATFRDDAGRERTAFVRAPLVSVVPPGLPHALVDEPGPRTLVLSIAAPLFTGLARAALEGAEPPVLEPHAAADPLLREIGNAVEDDLRRQRTPGAAYLESLAMVLAAHVARLHAAVAGRRPGIAGGLAPHKLRRVHEFIADHLAEPIRVEELARTVHLSPFHFARMFKQSTGRSPHLHILMQRVERAKHLLADSDAALVDVAAEAGFRTQGHFTGVFHHYTGWTPRMFRLNSRDSSRTDGPVAPPMHPRVRGPETMEWGQP
ncbi:helix-turn-helix transcriptional regulator [Ramlibacter ginsenosidimutans]|uniref:Helix-turn-helix transcriptional regulator n=1 Tax=Ramlibacter ginsenosidimutans TaxID=502333 RepID=A0A934WKX1_9BURK|nr:AraC family transcriptional regulator [Ramlibacter ginsenosidimutans]MBK6004803.1 helix-turn-helix transcriptional regulator [Ramlibacter ginsenosidimutans]